MSLSLSAIVPVYNEENFIEESLLRLLSVKELSKILVVDDNSHDNSVKIIKNIMKNNKKVFLYELDSNKGKGGAIKSVFKNLETDYTIIHDADLEYDPKDITKLFNEVKNNEEMKFVIGSRFKNSEKVQIYYRTFYANKLLSFLYSKIYGVNITDIATCYKLMPTSYLQNTKFEELGFAIEIELVSKYLKNYLNLAEVPISYTARSYKEGKKIKLIDGFRYLYTMYKYKK